MAIPADVVRLALFGTLVGGEIWNTNVWARPVVYPDPVVPDDEDSAQTLLNNFTTGTEWGAFLNSLLALQRPGDSIDGAKLYSYRTGGPAATVIAEKAITGPGTGSSSHPNQVCRVLTLRSAFAGRSRRGRMYLPAAGAVIAQSTGLFSDNGQTLVNNTANLFKHWANLTDAYYASIVSQTLGSAVSVIQVDTDQRADIQRRRADRENVGTRTFADATN